MCNLSIVNFLNVMPCTVPVPSFGGIINIGAISRALYIRPGLEIILVIEDYYLFYSFFSKVICKAFNK